ncbi:UDP-N-acetylmuramoylalanyl-D-glutamate--2,6-diaminopimelate ligase [Wolbachia pipientis]|uniref:UDP-N-acetylmuramoylalanyl-D-glutamate--2, 6-diaminopimelate ligase n=1 Tax=Wolbachia pipientis TaxID=955 RepID=A0A1E7QJ41_WOLPI|nr:UDP-N-acetylmuramoyl-L-alanyl-D-glutamate--2,6-diaminopimelate ligase [Wolbachia pipientis]OEY86488.1 UDP-N-acetylmuramoylalanyl-D-glutamate--2,6-diaminopimelate ligase [Wolbachia pipientis]
MKLKELLYNIIDTDFDIEIEGVTCNPRRIRANFLFVCIDMKCLNRITELPVATIISQQDIFMETLVIFHPHPQRIYSEVVSRFYRFKQPKYIAAVTGSSGKTSVVEFCRQIWQSAGYNAASIGSLGTRFNDKIITHTNDLTTPDPYDLYSKLHDINNNNIDNIAVEATSHGIDQYRIHGLKLSVAAFTNLLHDHLDHHGSIDNYFTIKQRLFYEILPEGGKVILNSDIEQYNILFNIAKERANKIITYGQKDSDITLLEQIPTQDGQYIKIKKGDRIYDTFFPVFGKFQAYNLLCAIGMSGVDLMDICVKKLYPPPGRMEKVDELVFVDYAHHAGALKQALLSLKWHFKKKVVLVFGCAGNRDKTKRPQMGLVAQKYADKVIVTDDNPRNEDPGQIRSEVLFSCPGAWEIGDRKKAIKKGIEIAYDEGMMLLITGKGNEQTQSIGSKTVEFKDGSIVKLLKSSHFS